MELIDNMIPNSMKLIGLIMIWKWEGVATFVSGWVLSIYSGDHMHWLMDISHEVHEETKCVGKSIVVILGALLIGDGFYDIVVVGIVAFLIEPVSDTVHGINDVVLGILEGEIIKGTSLVKIWLIFKVPV
jgi:hypothetical protein